MPRRTEAATTSAATDQFLPDMVKLLFYWIEERDNIRELRSMRNPPVQAPWTDDPTLRDHRFCNVYRMDDKVSQWLLDHWYHPHSNASDRTLLIAATLARDINWPDTLSEIGFPSRWSAPGVRAALAKRSKRGDKIFTGAYIINGAQGGPKYEQVVATVHEVAVQADRLLLNCGTMQELHKRLMGVQGIGSFIAGQIVADLRHTRVLEGASDALTWAPRGPGSSRGMNRLLGRDLHAHWRDVDFVQALNTLYRKVLGNNHARAVFEDRGCELMDLQNCLCEFDKYVRVQRGEGRAKNKFNGRAP